MKQRWTWRLGLARVLAVGLLLAAPRAFAFVHDPELGWGGTKHVDFSLITYLFDRQHCMRSDEAFFACVHLVNAMGSFSQPPVALLPREATVGWPSARVTVLREFGSLVLARLQDAGELPPSGPARTYVLALRQHALRQASNAAFREQRERIKRLTGLAELEFDLLTQELLQARAPGVSEAFAIGYAANALMAVHDPHSGFSVKDYERSLAQNADGAFIGIGARVEEIPGDTRLQIYRVIEGSPAERAGLRSLDVLLRVGAQSAIGLKINQLGVILRENDGKPIEFRVEREGVPLANPIVVTPTRISMLNPEVRVTSDLGAKVLHLKIGTFWDEHVCTKVRAALADGLTPEFKGVVLDLRDNKGGMLDKAACVAGLFVGPRRIVSERPVSGETKTKYYDSNEARMTKLPVAVLINDMTASAAEVVAGALQDFASKDPTLSHVFIVGTRSHGKGSVQRVSEFFEFPELLKAETVARYYLPLEHTIHLVGLKPDFEVFRGPQPTPEDRFAIREADWSFSPRPVGETGYRAAGPERAAEIKAFGTDCLRGQAEAIWKSKPGQDFQLLKAQELVTCRRFI